MSAIITRKQWTAENLPAGLTMSSGGIITGKPTAAGNYDVPVTVRTNWGTDTKNIHISVDKKIKWTARKVIKYSLQGKIGAYLYPETCVSYALSDDNKYTYFVIMSDITDSGISFVTISSGISSSSSYSIYGYGYATNYYNKRIFILGTRMSRTYIDYLAVTSETNGGGSIQGLNVGSNITLKAACYDENNDILFVFYSSKVRQITKAFSNTTPVLGSTYSIGATVSYYAAYNPKSEIICVFCTNGESAVSSDKGATWTRATMPTSLIELQYRKDIKKFFAVGESTVFFLCFGRRVKLGAIQ